VCIALKISVKQKHPLKIFGSLGITANCGLSKFSGSGRSKNELDAFYLCVKVKLSVQDFYLESAINVSKSPWLLLA
jgi:hypothetical protein